MRGVDRALAAWRARPHDAHPLVLMDFDGTLADFNVDPDAVTLPESRQLLLQLLGKRSDISGGIVSGRRVADLRERVPAASSLFFAGLHGLEIEGPDLRFVHQRCRVRGPGDRDSREGAEARGESRCQASSSRTRRCRSCFTRAEPRKRTSCTRRHGFMRSLNRS